MDFTRLWRQPRNPLGPFLALLPLLVPSDRDQSAHVSFLDRPEITIIGTAQDVGHYALENTTVILEFTMPRMSSFVGKEAVD